MVEINLLKEKRKDLIKQHILEKKRNKISYVVMVVTVVLFLVLQAIRIGLMVYENNLQTKIKKAQKVVASLRKVEEESINTINKSEEVDKVLKGRDMLKEKLRVVTAIFNGGIQLYQLNFGSINRGNVMSLNGTADSVFSFVDFSKRWEKLAADEGFEMVKQSSLGRDKNGNYHFSYDLTVKPKTETIPTNIPKKKNE